jgi:Terpene cyclase DEP1
MQRPLIVGTLVLFGALTTVALWQHGYWGILRPHFQSTGAGQVFADLVIALSLVMMWLVRDARASGRSAWPWIAVTLVAGSFGPLLYLLTRTSPLERRTAAVRDATRR